MIGEDRAQRTAIIVFARDQQIRRGQRVEQPAQTVILLLGALIDQITGRHNKIELGRKRVEVFNAALKVRRGIEPPVGRTANTRDVEIGNLRDNRGWCCGSRAHQRHAAPASSGITIMPHQRVGPLRSGTGRWRVGRPTRAGCSATPPGWACQARSGPSAWEVNRIVGRRSRHEGKNNEQDRALA